MQKQAALARRGSQTRGKVKSPIDVSDPSWVHSWLPTGYFSSGKADKALQSPLSTPRDCFPLICNKKVARWWEEEGEARVLFLGYQWRPDPAAGLIALSAASAQAEKIPLVIVWPRVFYNNGIEQKRMMDVFARICRFWNWTSIN